MSILLYLLSQEKYQNLLVRKASAYLSEKLHTKVEVGHVKFEFFNRFSIERVYIEDDTKDTLAYIGALQLKTSELFSNYWDNEPSVLHHVGLEDVYVHMKRLKDTSRWNYDFIAEAFSSGSTTDTTSPNEEPKPESGSASSPKIDLKHIELKRIRFLMDDAWRGEDMHFVINSLALDVKQLDLKNKFIALQQLAVGKADILVREYDGGKPEDLTPDDTTEWGTPFNPDLYKVKLDDLQLMASSFVYEVEGDPPIPHEFDENHLHITNINLALKQVNVVADSLFADITSLTAKERCGIEVKSLSAKAKVSQVQSYLDQLKLVTNYSNVEGRYEMNYRNFHDFNDYITKVNMKASLKPSTVSSLDIGYFANILNQYPINVSLKGNMTGTVDFMKATDIELHASQTNFIGDATITGLPDIEQTLFDVHAKRLKTSGPDLNRLIPQTKVDGIAWNELKNIEFSGDYTGHVDDFRAKGDLVTSLGNGRVDVNMNFKSKITKYDGYVKTDNFQLGKLIQQSTLGKISIDGTIVGQGFDLNDLDAKVNASVSYIEFDNNAYHDITINGLVSRKKFDGIFISQDPNLALNFNGKLDLSGKQPTYNFNSRFIKFNLQKIGLTKEPVIGSGMATLNFTGDNIDNFLGSAVLKNLVIESKGKRLEMDYAMLESTQREGRKQLRLTSNLADAILDGKFNISQLPSGFQLYLYHYLPEYIPRPSKFQDQAFTFDIQLKQIDTFVKMFAPDFQGGNQIWVNGDLNTYTQQFSMDATVPSFGYREFMLDSLVIIGAGDFNSLDLNANSRALTYNNDVIVPSFQLSSSMAHDTASLTINTQSINSVLGQASLSCKATALNSNLYVHVLPSNMIINNMAWNFNSDHDLVFGERMYVKDFRIETGPQQIVINTRNDQTDDLVAELENIDLENISEIINIHGPRYVGHLNGKIEVVDFMNHPFVSASLFTNDFLRINQDTVGTVRTNVQYDVERKLLKINPGTSITRNESHGTVEGFVNASDSTIHIVTDVQKLSISFINQFLSDYIQNIRGYASGNVYVDGSLSNPGVSGKIDLNDASLKVLFLGTTYFIDQARFNFNNRKIEMDDITVRDERKGNYSGNVKGYISHQNFKDFYLNFSVKSNNLLCLNTGEYDNELFYGYVPASINAKLTGMMNDVTVDIDAKPLKGAAFHLPINSTGDASTYDYIRFARIGRNQEEEKEEIKDPTYVKLNMNIDATPDADVFIILDKNTGEQIIARGNGAISLNVDLGNSIEMFGAYQITEGKYLFNFRGLLAKEFVIDEGSRITWGGDALNASMQVKALYNLPNPLSLYPLVSDQLESLDNNDPDKLEAKKLYKTQIELQLKGFLSQPEITFDILQPDNKATGTPAYNKLEQIRNDEKELVSQAGVLLLLGNFKASDGISNTAYGQGAISSVSDLISSAVSSEITNQFQNLTGLKNISLNVNYKSTNSGLLDNTAGRDQFSVNVSANLLKDRIVVDFGNSLDVGKNANGTSTSNFVGGDFKAQFLLSEDGRLRLNAYRTNNLDVEGENFTKGGVGLSYKKVFNSFNDLFFPKRRRRSVVKDTIPQTES